MRTTHKLLIVSTIPIFWCVLFSILVLPLTQMYGRLAICSSAFVLHFAVTLVIGRKVVMWILDDNNS